MESLYYSVPVCLQADGYSCLPCCVKAAYHGFGGSRISLRRIKQELGTTRDGTYIERAVPFFRLNGIPCIYLEHLKLSEATARKQLRAGRLIIASTVHNDLPHVVTLYGFTEQGRVRVMDPLGCERFYSSCIIDTGYLLLG